MDGQETSDVPVNEAVTKTTPVLDIEAYIQESEFLPEERAGKLRDWNKQVIENGLGAAIEAYSSELGLAEIMAQVDIAREEVADANPEGGFHDALRTKADERSPDLNERICDCSSLIKEEREARTKVEDKGAYLEAGARALQKRAIMLAEHEVPYYGTEAVLGSLWEEYHHSKENIATAKRKCAESIVDAVQKKDDWIRKHTPYNGIKEYREAIARSKDRTKKRLNKEETPFDELNVRSIEILEEPLINLQNEIERLERKRDIKIETEVKSAIDNETLQAATEVVKASKVVPGDKIDEMIAGSNSS